jgi:hypothetical protein
MEPQISELYADVIPASIEPPCVHSGQSPLQGRCSLLDLLLLPLQEKQQKQFNPSFCPQFAMAFK